MRNKLQNFTRIDSKEKNFFELPNIYFMQQYKNGITKPKFIGNKSRKYAKRQTKNAFSSFFVDLVNNKIFYSIFNIIFIFHTEIEVEVDNVNLFIAKTAEIMGIS